MAGTLVEQFGNIDIYVFDQLLRGRIAPGMRVLDAGCGGGRNLVYLLQHGFDASGNDANPAAIAEVSALAARLAPGKPHEFRVEAIERTSFDDASFDVVIANAVLHFARDDAQFAGMVEALWRVLKPGGVFFARLASTIGIDDLRPIEGRRYRMPDGSDWYLVDAETIESWTTQLGGELIDPIKTTVVHRQRAMTTWVAQKL